jgi:hypothetical protein
MGGTHTWHQRQIHPMSHRTGIWRAFFLMTFRPGDRCGTRACGCPPNPRRQALIMAVWHRAIGLTVSISPSGKTCPWTIDNARSEFLNVLNSYLSSRQCEPFFSLVQELMTVLGSRSDTVLKHREKGGRHFRDLASGSCVHEGARERNSSDRSFVLISDS